VSRGRGKLTSCVIVSLLDCRSWRQLWYGAKPFVLLCCIEADFRQDWRKCRVIACKMRLIFPFGDTNPHAVGSNKWWKACEADLACLWRCLDRLLRYLPTQMPLMFISKSHWTYEDLIGDVSGFTSSAGGAPLEKTMFKINIFIRGVHNVCIVDI
jgi:hypothetical protein